MNTSLATAMLSVNLRPYQKLAVDLLTAELARTGRAHLALPTGSGKSRVLVTLAGHYLNREVQPAPGTVLVVSPRVAITGQLARDLTATGHTVATLPSATDHSPTSPVIVGTAASLLRWCRRTANRPALILVDEAHHATATGCRRLLDAYQDANRAGVTATPYRHDGTRLDEVLGRCVMVRDPDSPDMVGVLSPVTWLTVPLPVDLGQVPTSRNDQGRDYVAGRLGAVLTTPAAIAATVAGTSAAIRDRPTVVFAATVEQGRALADAYRAAGHRIGEVYGTTPRDERVRMVEALILGPAHPDGVGILVSVGALTEGFDCPPVSALVIARPTRSELLYTQMMGRGLRSHPGKVDCLVLDVTDADGTAAPTATGQVFAPTVVPSARPADPADEPFDGQVDDEHPESATDEWWSPTRQVRQMVGTDRRAPAWSWAPGPDGKLIVPLADGQVGVLTPDGESGLWSPLIVTDGGVVTLDGPLPARYAVDRFTGMADRHLTRANSRWRSDPPTGSQLSALRRWDPVIADRATSGGWTKGHVGDVLGALIAHRKITSRVWTESIGDEALQKVEAAYESIGEPVSPEPIAAASTPLYHRYHTSADLGTPSQVRKEASGVDW